MKQWAKVTFFIVLCLGANYNSQAQDLSDDMQGLQVVLEKLYIQMLPLCSKLIGVGQGLAGFAALWYIASRVWRHLANAEPIDFYPLFRPFVLGFCVLIFPSVIALINGIMQPTVKGSAAMVEGSNRAIAGLLKQKEAAIKKTETWQMFVGAAGSGDRDRWYKYTHPDEGSGDGEGIWEAIGNDLKFAMDKASYNFRNSIKEWMSEVLKVLYQAAALCINTIRTFYMIVLAIIGPLVFAISIFDGFQYTLTVWIARYINIFLWLPVANIFGSIIGKIQENMLKLDIQQVNDMGDTFFSSTDTAYLIFLIIGIIGYFTVPSVANYIVHAGGVNALLHRVTGITSSYGRSVSNMAQSGGSMVRDAFGDTKNIVSNGFTNAASSKGYFNDRLSGK